MTYVFDTGALIAAERGRPRATRFLKLADVGDARIVIPLVVVAEWWRGRTKVRDTLLAASHVVASLDAMKAAGIALARSKHVDASFTTDAIVMATAALDNGIVVTSDPADFEQLSPAFPGVTVLAV